LKIFRDNKEKVYHESEVELSRRIELPEVCEEEEVVGIVQGLAKRNELDFGGNFHLKIKSFI
jgi:hypothetical protein